MKRWLLLAVWTASAGAATPIEIRLASPDIGSAGTSSSGTGPVDYAYVRHLYEDEFAHDGIRVRWKFFKGAGPAVNEAIVNRQIDFAFIGDLPAIIGRAVGSDTRLLAGVVRGANNYLGVVPGKGYDSLEKLRGKQIGVWLGTASHLGFDAVLAQHGYSEKDFRIINLDPSAAMAALATRRIDAAWSAANLLVLQQRGLIDIPLSTKGGDGTGTFALGLVGRGGFVREHPDLTLRVVKVLLRASQWVSVPANHDRIVELVTQQAHLPEALLRDAFRGEDLGRMSSPLLDGDFLGQYRDGVQAAWRTGLIRQTFDVDAWAEPRFVEQALQELRLEDFWTPRLARVAVSPSGTDALPHADPAHPAAKQQEPSL
ncbi:MAG: ABC transporter substrate-binding protein [Solimonas sp.]